MLTRFPLYSETELLRPALRAAVAAHRPIALRNLRAAHGNRVFARALAGLSGRAIADVLSMLHAADRAGVCAYLPREARKRLADAGGVDSSAAEASPSAARISPLGHLAAGP